VQVLVAGRTFSLAVQAVRFTSDGDAPTPGGLFDDAGELGILVDGEASPSDIQAQIVKASAEAVRELSRRYLN
jgi:hypothetical protein